MLRVLRRVDQSFEPAFRVRCRQKTYVLDFAYPRARIGIECHSIRWHMGEDAFKRDARRDRHLKAAGWTLLYYCWDDLAATREVEEEIRAILRNPLV